MILRAIEEAIRTPKSEAVGLLDKLTVEHLLPQNGTLGDYPFADTMPLQTGETPERCRNLFSPRRGTSGDIHEVLIPLK
jgi:hypothetical protein